MDSLDSVLCADSDGQQVTPPAEGAGRGHPNTEVHGSLFVLSCAAVAEHKIPNDNVMTSKLTNKEVIWLVRG